MTERFYRVAVNPEPGRFLVAGDWNHVRLRLDEGATLDAQCVATWAATSACVDCPPVDKLFVTFSTSGDVCFVREQSTTGRVRFVIAALPEAPEWVVRNLTRGTETVIHLSATQSVRDVLRAGGFLRDPDDGYRVSHPSFGRVEVYSHRRRVNIYTLTMREPNTAGIWVPAPSAADRALRDADALTTSTRAERNHVIMWAALCNAFRERSRQTIAELATATGYTAARVTRTLRWAEEKDWAVRESDNTWRLAEEVGR